MKRSLPFVLGAFFASCAAPTSSDEEAIIGGTLDPGDPAMVAVFSAPPGATQGILCTGTLIAPTIVLTAGHCVAGTDIAPDAVFQILTTNDMNKPVQSSQLHKVISVAAHPDYDKNSQANDIAVVVLSEPLAGVAPVPFLDAPLPADIVGSSVRVIGYGVDRNPPATGAGIKRQVTVPVTSTTASLVQFGNADHDSCFGDSGGPSLLRVGSQEYIVGVASTVNQPACHAGANYTRVDQYRSWLKAWAPSGGGNPSPSTPGKPAEQIVTWGQLAGIVSTCSDSTKAITPQCMTAYHRFCRSIPGNNTGVGPVSKNTTQAWVVCMHTDVTQAYFSDWDSQITSCNGTSPTGVASSACASAVHRHCRALGQATGFGPVEHSGNDATISCLDTAQSQVVQSTYTELVTYHPSCEGSRERWGGDCTYAIDQLCKKRGYVGGYGPVENSGNDVTIVCINPVAQ